MAATTDPSLGKGPVGWDIYRHLDQLPTLPVGVHTAQFASTDPAGQNGDFNHTLGRAPDGSYILARHTGPGEIDAIWTTSNGGDVSQTGNIRITLDGKVVLNAPEQAVVDGTLGAPFTFPLVANASQSSGGDYIDVPMPFTSSMEVTTTNDPIYYHVDYRSFANATGVSTFSPTDPASDVVAALSAAGTRDPKGPQPGETTTTAPVAAATGATDTVGTFQGPGRIDALSLALPQLATPQAAPGPTAVAATGAATIPINPHNRGIRLTRRLLSGTGGQAAAVVVGGKTVATLPPVPSSPTASAHWARKTVTLPPSVTAGASSIRVVPQTPSGTSRFSYQVTTLAAQGQASTASTVDDLLQHVRLRITFDGTQTVDAPLGQFFGSALGEAPVQALMMAVNPQQGTLTCWWPMPYARSATVALYNGSGQALTSGTARITTAPVPGEAQALGSSGQDGYFHATAKTQDTVAGENYPLLRQGSWGKLVGVSESMVGGVGPQDIYLEGNAQSYADGSPTAQWNGTGTEDFYQGGWYFNHGPFTDPLNGNPADQSSGSCQYGCTAAYRLMLAEAVPFSFSINFGIQHGPINTTPANYASTAFWYGRSGASPALYHPLSLQGGWNPASGTNPPSYVEEGPFVRLVGGVGGGTVGQPIAYLPASLAPRADESFPVVSGSGVASLVVHPDGSIVLSAGNPGFVSLSGIVVDVGDATSYQPLALQNGWSPAPSSYGPGSSPGYVQNGSEVELTGSLTGGTPGQVIARLPANLTPAADEWFPVVTANNVIAPLVVHPDGAIVLNAGNPGFLSLAGVSVTVGPPGGSNLSPENGWSAAPGTNAPGFTQWGREVDLRGGLTGGGTGQALVTLPSSAAPSADEWFPVVTAGNVVAPLVAHPGGDIVLTGGNPAFVSLQARRVSQGPVDYPATALQVSAPPTATTGGPVAIQVRALDAEGGTATTYTGTVSFSSSDPAATLPGPYAFTAGDAGAHAFSVTFATPGSQTVTATDAPDGLVATSTPVTVSSPPTPSAYAPLSPTRICDTRTSSSANQCTGKTLSPGGTLSVDMPAQVPAGATAVVANVTVTNTGGQGYLSVFPAGGSLPTVSNLNFTGGQTVANTVTVALGPSGGTPGISIYDGPPSGTGGPVDVVVDLEGYYAPPSATATGTYTALAPERLADTRCGTSPPPSFCAGENLPVPNQGLGTLGPGGSTDVTVAGVDSVPAEATAVVLNVGMTNTTAPSYLTAWPSGESRPLASNQNWVPGETLSSKVIVPVGTGGKVSLYNYAGSADAVVDVDGYYTTSGGSLFVPTTPTRILDTRPAGVGPGSSATAQVTGTGGVPASATGAVLDVVDIAPAKGNYLTVYPTGQSPPVATDVNWVPGNTYNVVPNASYARLGSGGAVSIYNGPPNTNNNAG
ncbi:MAG TPA: glycoside hydrolase family 172 protein, partial [Acidimicrobiales bacterium]|nr:glycoside hydrolase family 172 protein [Acidimicrobiales bacterium]